MRKFLPILFCFMALPGMLFAGSINDSIKNTQTPYLGEKGGFDSLFVNPAGMAGQTDAFNISILGSVTVPPDLTKTLKLLKEMNTESGSGAMTADTMNSLKEILANNLDINVINDILNNSGIGPLNAPEDLLVINFSDPTYDLGKIAENLEGMDEKTLLSAFDNVAQVHGTASLRLGTLIKGFGLALYNADGFTYVMGNKGISNLATETGIQLGLGFKLFKSLPLTLGVSGNVALMTLHDSLGFDQLGDLKNAPMGYTLSYGLNVGAQMGLPLGFTVGAVLTNIIGSKPLTNADYIQGTLNGFLKGETGFNPDYVVSTDLSVGVTWAPDLGKWFKPKLALDYYDFISLFRQDELTWEYALSNMRLGANLQLAFLDLGFQYYQNYFSLGAGFDFNFLTLYVEGRADKSFDDLGGSVMVNLKF